MAVLESHLQGHVHEVVVGVGTTVVAVASILTWGVINAVNQATSLAIVTRCGATAAGWLGLSAGQYTKILVEFYDH